MSRAALLLCGAVLALLVGGASAGAWTRTCAPVGGAPSWSPTGRWIAWDAGASEGVNGICFSRPNGTHPKLLTLPSELSSPYELVWATPNLLVGLSNSRLYSVAFRPSPQVLAQGTEFSGPAGDVFSLDAKADVLATGSYSVHGTGTVTIMWADGRTASVGDSSVANYDPSPAPDGKHVVWAAWPGGILTASIDGTHVKTLAAEGARPLWSPTGRKIAFEYEGLSVMTSSGSHRTTVARGCCGYGDPQTIAWSPNGKLIAFVNDADHLAVVDVRTKHVRTVKHIGVVYQFAWAPSSAELLVSAGPTRADPSLWRVRLRNGKPTSVSAIR